MRYNFLKENHGGGLVGHFDHDKTCAQLSSFYYWSGMRINVKNFMDRCKICQFAKGRQQNVGLYQPLPIPDRPWESMSMEFFMGLLKKKRKRDMTFVMVEKISNMAHFIPCSKTNDDTHIASLVFKEVVRLHVLLRSIVSNQDTKFVGNFWIVTCSSYNGLGFLGLIKTPPSKIHRISCH